MSSDDFQTKYASFMESMLKGAVAETTKLYETMVDELKAEICRIKKENEDLRTKCSQFENAKSQSGSYQREKQPLPGQSNDSEKCDTAVQCDIVSFRTVLVEQCQPLGQSSLKNQQMLHAGERIGYGLQEQGGNSQMTFILVKQEEPYSDTSLQSELKEEEVESAVASEQALSNVSDSLHVSLNGTENEGMLINQEDSTEETTSTQKDEETRMVPEVSCMGESSHSEGAQSQTTDTEHSIVISLAAMTDNIKEESEVDQETSEVETQVPQQCQRDGETVENEQTAITVQPSAHVHCADEQLAGSILFNKEVICEELKNSLAEDEATSKTNVSVRRRRGRPPKKIKQKEALVSSTFDALEGREQLNTPSEIVDKSTAVDAVKISASASPRSSGIQSKDTSSTANPSVQEMASTDLENMDNRKVGSLPASVLSLSSSSSEKPVDPQTQQLPTGVEKKAVEAPSIEGLSANKTLNSPPLDSPQLTPGQHKERRTSVTLQDAMLLVEAMNQSTMGNVIPSSEKISSPLTHCAPSMDTLQTVDKIPVKPQTQNLPVKSQSSVEANETLKAFVIPQQQQVLSNAATQTFVLPSSHPVAPRKLTKIMPKIITVVPRVGPSHNIASSTTKLSSIESRTTHNSLFATSGVAGLPLETPPLFCVPQQTNTTSMTLVPVSQLTKPSANQHTGGPPHKKITIIVPIRLAAVAPSKHQPQTIVVKAMQEAATPRDVPVTVTSAQSTTASQELSVSACDDTAFSQSENTADSPESPEQTASVSEVISTPTETSLEQSVKIIPASQPTVGRKLTPVVRLTKLPFSISPNETVLVSKLCLKGFSEGIMQEKSSKPAISEKLESSSSSSLDVTEMPSPGTLNTPQKSEESNNHEPAQLSSETFTVMREATVSEDVQPSTSATSVEPIPNLDSSDVQENESAIIQLTSMSREASDPHLQMTKAQFLAQLAVSPIVQDPEKQANSDFANGKASLTERSLQKNSLVVRLRSHLKTHLQVKRAETSLEGNSESESTTAISKKLGIENGNLNGENSTKETSPVCLERRDVVKDNTALINNALSSISPVRSILCNGGDLPKTTDNEPTSVTSRANSDSTTMSPKADSTHRDGLGTDNKKSTSVSPREGNLNEEIASPEKTSVTPRRSLGRDSACPRYKKSSSLSPRRSPSGRKGLNCNSSSLSSRSPSSTKESGSPKMTKNDTAPRNEKSSSVSLLMSTRGSTSPKKTDLPSVSPRTPSLRQSGIRRSSLFSKDNSRTKRIKRELRSFGITTDGAITRRNKGETCSPSVKSPTIAKNGISPTKTEESIPAKKPRLIQDVTGPKRGFKVVNAMKLAKAAKAKKIASMKKSNKSKLAKSRLSESRTNCGVGKKCRAKVWIPPVMTESEMPPSGEKESSLLNVKTETGSDNQNPSGSPDSPQPKFVTSPIVSPLQPLSVIGRHLLRNQCGECGRILSSSAALESHVSLHTGHRPFSCTFCGKNFPDSKSFKRHGRVHRNGRIHICQHCGKGFVYRFGLTKHIQMVHGKIRPFICQVCNKGFFTKRDVEVHIRIHTGEKPFQCTLCERKFIRRVELNVHLRWHNGEKRHWCPFCGKGFLDYNNLKRHKYTHTGEKPHACPHCPKKFTQTGHLKKHVKNVHGGR